MNPTTSTAHDPEPRTPFPSVVPPTPAEEAAMSVRWERRGVLRRLARAN
jgi:hypothetical protein